jgi:hypothetical protein
VVDDARWVESRNRSHLFVGMDKKREENNISESERTRMKQVPREY